MNNITELENQIIRQTCRSFAYKFEMDSCETEEPSSIYSLQFLKNLYDKPKDNINKIIISPLLNEENEKVPNQTDDLEENSKRNTIEKRILLHYFNKVNDMKSSPAKKWTDLQHYLCFVYRYCMTSDPDPEQEVLSSYFIEDIRYLVCKLMEEDQIQLCLRLFALVREYTIFAYTQHQKIGTIEASVESLFYYYEAFLSATKNICKLFPELEKIIINAYKLGWLDFNTSIFMNYFYETPYVQKKIKEFETMKDKVTIKAAGIYTVLTELNKLWRSQILAINGVITNKLGAKCKVLDSSMMTAHRKILSKNFWIDRSLEEKAGQDMKFFGYQLFTLVGDKSLAPLEPTLNEFGQCICEDCLIFKYRSQLENKSNNLPGDCMMVSCRFCKCQVVLDHFQQHITDRALSDLTGYSCKNSTNLSQVISGKIDRVKLGIASSKNSKSLNDNKLKTPSTNGVDTVKEPSPKLASEPPIFAKQKLDDSDMPRVSMQDIKSTRFSRNSFYNFLKQRNALTKSEKETKAETAVPKNLEKAPQPPLKPASKGDDSKAVDLLKGGRGINVSGKSNGTTFPCGHSCKLEEELKSEFKKAYQETCDHHKEPKKCDCTFCESSHVHKSNETRNRLRIRLNQRNEKIGCKTGTNNKVNTTKSNLAAANKNLVNGKPDMAINGAFKTSPASDNSNGVENNLINDIHGLLNYIEGNMTTDKVALVEKKAAKKARQRLKKEQEKQRVEEEEKRQVEEEKRKVEERLKNEELKRQLAEKAKNSKKENKKKKKNKDTELMEETIPAMVTIKRVVENNNSLPTVTITLKGSTPDQDKLLYTLVNGCDGVEEETINEKKSSKKNKNQNNMVTKTVNLEVNTDNNKKKNKNKNYDKNNHLNHSVITKELRVTLAVDPTGINEPKKTNNNNNNKQNLNKVENKSNCTTKRQDKKDTKAKDEPVLNIPMLRLPPGITITKVDGPMADRNYKSASNDSPPYNSNIPVSKSGVIVVDTEKLIKQSVSSTTPSLTSIIQTKKSRKKRNKKQNDTLSEQTGNNIINNSSNNKPSMVTLKNPIFQNLQNGGRHDNELISDIGGGQCQQAAIFKNENGMVTIRSSRLQQSLSNGSPMPNLLSDLKPVLGPEVPIPFMSSCSFPDSSRISPFNAQEILSGLPGIEITKVDKHATKNELDNKKACHTAEVSIIPASNGDKFANFDKDDLHYDNVFTPKDILDDMDAEERELEAFKRFCQQSVPPKRKEKVAHLNVKDIVLKKKNDKISG